MIPSFVIHLCGLPLALPSETFAILNPFQCGVTSLANNWAVVQKIEFQCLESYYFSTSCKLTVIENGFVTQREVPLFANQDYPD